MNVWLGESNTVIGSLYGLLISKLFKDDLVGGLAPPVPFLRPLDPLLLLGGMNNQCHNVYK